VAKETQGLAKWVDRLGSMDLPVLSGVVHELNQLAESQEVSADLIAATIVKDPSLTTQVLRIANSVHYSPGIESEIASINRAVVQLGVSGVQAICISLMVIDSIVGDKPKQQLITCMAKGFHAATQAKYLGGSFDSRFQEECFIAGLLMNIGEMAFLSRGGKQALAYEKMVYEDEVDPQVAAQTILGTDFKSISLGLAKKWELGETLVAALSETNQNEPKVMAVILAEQISQTAVLGWESPEFGSCLAHVSELTGKSMNDAKEGIIEAALDAASVVVTYGIPEAAKLIPNSEHLLAQLDAQRQDVLQPDAQLQLDILRQLGAALAENSDINQIFKMVVEGLHRGVGFERVVIGLLNPKEKSLSAKYIVGEGAEKWQGFKCDARRADDNIFADAMINRETLLIKSKKDPRYRHLMTLECLQVLSKGSFIIAAIQAGGRDIGFFYADRGDTGQDIKGKQFESFKYFVQQANAALARLANKTVKVRA
jgi:HD-like signal output (HDOD) protein